MHKMGILDGRLQVMECGDGGGRPGRDRGSCVVTKGRHNEKKRIKDIEK